MKVKQDNFENPRKDIQFMSEISENNKRIAKNSIFMSIRMVIVLLITLYSTRVVLEVLGVEDYGIYNVVCGFVSMFAFLSTSMSNGIQRFFNFELGRNGEEGAKNVYNTAIYIQLILIIIILICSESFGIWYINNKMVIPAERLFAANWIFQFSLLSFIFIIIQAPYTAAVIAHEKMDFYAVVSILDAFLKLCIVFLIPYLKGDDLIWYGILLASVSLMNFVLYFTYCKRKFTEIVFEKGFDKQMFKSMLGFSSWNVFGSLSIMMKEHGINLVLNLFFGPIVNAARAVAHQVNAGINSFVSNITMPVRPQVTQSYAKGNIDRSLSLTYSVCKLSCFFFFMIAFPICLEVNRVLDIWLVGNAPKYSNIFVVIVLATTFTSNLHSSISNLVHATGEMKKFQLYTSAIKLCSVPLAYYLLKFYNYAPLALYVVLITDLLAHYVGCLVLSKITDFPLNKYLTKVIFPILAVVIVSGAIISVAYYCLPNTVLRFILIVIISIVITSIGAYCIGMNQSEKQLVRNFASNIKHKIFNYDKL